MTPVSGQGCRPPARCSSPTPSTESGPSGRCRQPRRGRGHGRLASVTVDAAAEFQAERGRLFGLAYRLLGSAADAEDVVHDAFVRWHGADRASIAAPSAWLAKVVTNLCLNRLSSAAARRERYVGP